MSGQATADLVVGIGNRWRRDDGAGLLAAQRLRELLQGQAAAVEVCECGGDLSALLDLLPGRHRVFVLDAAAAPAVPLGQVVRIDAIRAALPASPPRSTHALGLAQVVELLRALGTLPAALVVYAIGAADFTPGEGLSPTVDAAVDAAVSAVHTEVAHA